MPEYGFLKKFLPSLEKELPSIESSGARALEIASPEAEVLGQGTSKASFSDNLPVSDADTLSPQIPNNAVPNDLQTKLQQLKNLGLVGGAGTAATLAMNSGSGAPETPIASRAPASQDDSEPVKSKPEDEGEEDGSEEAPSKAAGKTAVSSVDQAQAPGMKKPSRDIDFGQDSLGSRAQLAQIQAMQNRAQLMAGLAGIGAQMATGGQSKNQYEQQNAALMKQTGEMVPQYMQQVAFQKEDPNSSVSQGYRQLAASMGFNIRGDASAADIEKLMPQFANIMTREDTLQARKEMATERAQEQHFRNQVLQMQQQDRADQKKQQTYNQTVQLLEQMRGSPAVAQAEKDIYAADKAKGLQNLAGGDLNKLNPEMVKLLVSEVGKIAAGGVSTQSELQALTPETLRSRFGGAWEKLVNQPTSANAGAFLKQYMSYADQIKQDAQKVITDRYGRIINSRAGQFNPDQLQELRENYINRFTNPLPVPTAKTLAKAGQPQPVRQPAAPEQASGIALPTQDAISAEIARRKALKSQESEE